MKFSKIAFTLIAATSLFFACQKEKQPESPEPQAEVVDMHNSQNSVDWPGTYFGTIPAASSPGINTLITLNDDNTFEKTVYYLESNDTPETTTGTFKWSEDKSIITIEENTYKVGENQLFMLDINNKEITGEMAKDYILTKTELQVGLDVNEGYTLNKFVGDDKVEYDIVFNTNGKVPTALINYGDISKILMQTQAWAKGGEYAGDKLMLNVKGDKATLTIDKKKIKLTAKK